MLILLTAHMPDLIGILPISVECHCIRSGILITFAFQGRSLTAVFHDPGNWYEIILDGRPSGVLVTNASATHFVGICNSLMLKR